MNKKMRCYAGRHMIHHISLRIRRSILKSLLSAGLSLLMLGAISQYIVLRGEYRDMYEHIEIKAYFMGGLNFLSAATVDASKYVSAPYYESVINTLECNFSQIHVIMTTDILRARLSETSIDFLEGYDFTSFHEVRTKENNICVVENRLMGTLGIELGDKVRLNDSSFRTRMERSVFVETTDEETMKRQIAAFDSIIESTSSYFTVVGIITSEDARGNASSPYIYIPVGTGLNKQFETPLIFDYIEYTLNSAEYADEFSLFAKKQVAQTLGSVGSTSSAFTMDTGEADNMLRTVEMLDTLFPFAVAIALLLGGLIPGLIVVHSDREAAIMRALGAGNRRVRAIMVLEQLILCLTGFLLCAAVFFLINGYGIAPYIPVIGLYVALYIIATAVGTMIFSVIITMRKVMELLQVKE